MYLLVILLPLVSSVFSGLFGKYLGRVNSLFVSICNMILTTAISYFIFYEVMFCGSSTYIYILEWFSSGPLSIKWSFLFDPMTATMLIVVNTVSLLVHVYSCDYMRYDPHLNRFMSYLSFFTVFMILLVTSDNLIILFMGWEGVGLCSYLLINFWFTRVEANKSAIKAVLVNKIGDFSIMIAIASIFYITSSLDYSTLITIAPFFREEGINSFGTTFSALDFIAFFLFLGCVGKSAQIGLHTWLPDAMEGPTPVSALIHAATMVTAGVFLIIRVSPLIDLSETVLSLLVVFGSLTCIMAALIGCVQNDLKKVIAYSTCSQLGYMVMCCGVSNYNLSLFHLMNHAFFKALLFLGAGAIIHAVSDEQDMRKMGGLVQLLPVSYVCMLVASLSLMGTPFLTGYYSKDIILESSFAEYNVLGHFAYWSGTLAAFLTAFYSLRLLFLTFFKKTSLNKNVVLSVHDGNFYVLVPFVILFIGSIFAGYLLSDLFIGPAISTWGPYSILYKGCYTLWDMEFIPVYIKVMPTLFSFCGALLSSYTYVFYKNEVNALAKRYFEVYYTLSNKFNFDNIYNEYLVKPLLHVGYHVTFKTIDRGFVEQIGPYGLSITVGRASQWVKNAQSGFIYNYSFIIITYLIIYLLIMVVPFPYLYGFDILVILFVASNFIK